MKITILIISLILLFVVYLAYVEVRIQLLSAKLKHKEAAEKHEELFTEAFDNTIKMLSKATDGRFNTMISIGEVQIPKKGTHQINVSLVKDENTWIDEMEVCQQLSFSHLWSEHAEFSMKTFGADRSPGAPLHHLLQEVKEAIENPTDLIEYADILLLLIDASRLAGLTPAALMEVAFCKLDINKQRKWSKADENGVCNHIEDIKVNSPEVLENE